MASPIQAAKVPQVQPMLSVARGDEVAFIQKGVERKGKVEHVEGGNQLRVLLTSGMVLDRMHGDEWTIISDTWPHE